MTIAPFDKYSKKNALKNSDKNPYQKQNASSVGKKPKCNIPESHKANKLKKNHTPPFDDQISKKDVSDENNSADEYSTSKLSSKAFKETRNEEINKKLEDRGLKVINMKEDGSCLFRAIAQQIYGDQEKHAIIREKCLKYIEENWGFFKDFVTEDKESYLKRKHDTACHGNHVEIAAMSFLYNTKIEIYTDENTPMNTFDSPTKHNINAPPLRLNYKNNSHYDAIVDCLNPLVNCHLASIHCNKLQKKPHSNEITKSDSAIENSYIQLQLKQADWEDTESEIVRRVEQESIIQWHQHNNARSSVISQQGENENPHCLSIKTQRSGSPKASVCNSSSISNIHEKSDE